MTFTTGITHGRRRGFLPEARSADERVSLTAVVEAVSEIMEASNRGGIVDRALAARIGSQIQRSVAQALGSGKISSGAELLGQPAFRTILTQHLASTSSTYTDEEARRNMLEFMRRHANRTGAEFANFVAQFLRGGGTGARHASGSDSSGNRSSYDELDLAGLANDPAMASVLRDADKHGCGWMRGSRELLGLGHHAVAALVAVQFQRESFRLMREVGFSAGEVVSYARYAKERNIDANRGARTVNDTVNALAGDDPRERERILALMKKHFEQPQNKDAERALQEELNRQAARGEAQRRAVDKFRRDHRLEQQLGAESRVTAQADGDTAQQAEGRRREEADIGKLDALLTDPAAPAQNGAGHPPAAGTPGHRTRDSVIIGRENRNVAARYCTAGCSSKSGDWTLMKK